MDLAEELSHRLANTDFADACQAVVQCLRSSVPHYNWVGIYLLEGEELVLTAWAGPAETEHTRIPVGAGICGLAAAEGKTIIVDDVAKDPRYLACFLSTKSEIVVPIFREGRVIGEIDIDSDQLAAFTEEDRRQLEGVAALLGAVARRAGGA